MALNYAVHAMGHHYSSFSHEENAQEWALAQSKKFTNCWWEIRHVDRMDYLIIAFENGQISYGHDRNLLEELMS